MDNRERFAELEEALRLALRAERATVWTTLPGIIVSFDPDEVTATVQPALQGVVQSQDGTAAAVNLPLLIHCPVVFPRGGGVTLTFPVAAGDECMLNFSARCIDGWWQAGGIQLPMEPRMHDLSDAFCTVGPMSQTRKIAGISTVAAQLRTDDGNAFVELVPANHAISITTVGDVSVVAGGDLVADITGDANLTASSWTFTGPAQFNDPVHFMDDVTGDTTANFTVDVIAAGKSGAHHSHVVPLVQAGAINRASNPPT